MNVTALDLKDIVLTGGQESRIKDVTGLVKSIQAIGMINPIQVVKAKGDKYRIVAGRRRYAAAKAAGWEAVPAIILEIGDARAQAITVSENTHRKQFTPLEEAEAIKKLADLGRSIQDIAADLAMPPYAVARRAKLIDLIPAWQKRANDTPVAVLEIVARYSPERQKELARLFQDWDHVGVKELQRKLSETEIRLSIAPWKQDDAGLVPEVGSCAECPKLSSRQPLLFHDDATKAFAEALCLDRQCWDRKLAAHIAQRVAALKATHKDLVLISTEYGCKVAGALGRYDYAMAHKGGTEDTRPALIVDGPRAGSLTRILAPLDRNGRPAKPKKKVADLSPAQAAKVRAERLYGRRAKHVVLAITKLLNGDPRALAQSKDREVIMVALSVEFGLHLEHYHSVSSWPRFTKQLPVDRQRVFAAWWKAIQRDLEGSIAALRTCEDAAAALQSLKFLVEGILGADWSKLETDAIAAIPNRQIKKGQKDIFDPRPLKRPHGKRTAEVAG